MKRFVVALGLAAALAPLLRIEAQGWVDLHRSAPNDTTFHPLSPRTALVSGIIFPGGGQIYAGEWRRGLNYFRYTFGFGLVSLMAYTFNDCTFNVSAENPCSGSEQRAYKVLGAITGAGALTAWAMGAMDAPRTARRVNADRQALRGQDTGRGGASPYFDVGRNGALLAGLSLTL